MDSLPVTHYSRYASTEPPKASICIVGGTNIAHALATSSHVSTAFTLETRFGSSPSAYYGEFEGAPFITSRCMAPPPQHQESPSRSLCSEFGALYIILE